MHHVWLPTALRSICELSRGAGAVEYWMVDSSVRLEHRGGVTLSMQSTVWRSYACCILTAENPLQRGHREEPLMRLVPSDLPLVTYGVDLKSGL